jgi:hypothetical protein
MEINKLIFISLPSKYNSDPISSNKSILKVSLLADDGANRACLARATIDICLADVDEFIDELSNMSADAMPSAKESSVIFWRKQNKKLLANGSKRCQHQAITTLRPDIFVLVNSKGEPLFDLDMLKLWRKK